MVEESAAAPPRTEALASLLATSHLAIVNVLKCVDARIDVHQENNGRADIPGVDCRAVLPAVANVTLFGAGRQGHVDHSEDVVAHPRVDALQGTGLHARLRVHLEGLVGLGERVGGLADAKLGADVLGSADQQGEDEGAQNKGEEKDIED